jgi:hypothetical protein
MNVIFTRLMAGSLCGAACAPLPAKVQATPDALTLREGESARISARLVGAWPQPAWAWSSDGGTILGGEDGWATFLAPRIQSAEASFKVRVAPATDSGQEAFATITVLPSLAAEFAAALKDARMTLLAGHPTASGKVVGPGLQARFGDIVHLARLDHHPDAKLAGQHLLVDRSNHRILLMAADGAVQPWLGSADGKAGHVDGLGAEARFDRPAAIVVRPSGKDWPEDWQAVIVDTGNQVLRQVDAKGNVSLLAGAFELSGHQDDPAEGPLLGALFSSPRGAAYGPDGALYITDGENRVIRKLFKGRVSTLAGRVQEAGLQDGTGDAARFQFPSAIVLDRASGHLLVSDVHSIRQVTLDSRVTTLAGCSDSGFEQALAKAPDQAAPNRMAGIPCLDVISGLSVEHGQLLITELGNNAVRRLDLATGELSTLLAGPGDRPGFRAGLIQGGADRASITGPSHSLLDPDGRRGLIAMGRPYATGSCVAALQLAGWRSEAGVARNLDAGDGKATRREPDAAPESKAAAPPAEVTIRVD